MIGFKFISALGLLGAALAQTDTDYTFTTNVTNYVHDGDIVGRNTYGTQTWIMQLGSAVKSVQYSGNISSLDSFNVLASHLNQGLDFGYHGGVFNVTNIQFNIRSSPLHLVLEGESFSAQSFFIWGAVGQSSFGYMDFPGGFNVLDNNIFTNFAGLTVSSRTAASGSYAFTTLLFILVVQLMSNGRQQFSTVRFGLMVVYLLIV